MLRIAEDCAKLGHTVTIYTGQWRGDLPQGNIDVQILPSKGWLNHQRHQSLIDGMQAAIKTQKVDLIVGFNRMAGLDAYYAADPCFIARAYEEKNWFYRLSGRFRFFRDCEKAVFAKQVACDILLLTQRDKVVFQQWYQTPDARLHVLPPNIPVDKFSGKDQAVCRAYVRKQFGLPEHANVVLTVGSAYLRKGVDRAVITLANLPDAVKNNTWLVAVGEHESSNTFIQDAKKLGIAEHCILAGGRSDVADLMLGADVLAHPARSELAGLVIVEAMTAGLPVLVTETCGYAYHVAKANAGIVIDTPFDQAKFNQAFLTMLESSERPIWAKNGFEYTQKLMSENKGNAEANILIELATRKKPQAN